MRIGRWSEPRFVFVCQLVEVTREADANETSGELGLAPRPIFFEEVNHFYDVIFSQNLSFGAVINQSYVADIYKVQQD